MLSTELLLLPLMPPPLLPPLMPPQVRATRALARLRGGSTDHGSSARPAIYPWRAGIPAFPPLGQRRLAQGGLPPPSPSLTGEQSGAPAGKLTTLGLAAARRTVRRAVLRPLLLLLRAKPPVGALLLLQAYQLLRRKSILEDASSFFPTSRRRSRSLSLDTGDREYEQEGGVHFVRAELYRVLLADAIARGVARGVAREPRGVPAGAATADAATADAATADGSAAGAAGAASAGGGGGTRLDERWWRHCERLYNRYGWRGTASADGTGSGAEAEAEAEAEEAEEAEEGAEAAEAEEGMPPRYRRGGEEMPPAEAAEAAHLEAMAAGLGLSCGPAVSRQAFVRRSGEQLATLRATRQALEALQALEPPRPSPQAGTRGGEGEGAPGAPTPAASAGLDQPSGPSEHGQGHVGHAEETLYMGRAVETLLELRAADALTRLLRDQMMRSAAILEHAQARYTYYGYTSPGGHRAHMALGPEALTHGPSLITLHGGRPMPRPSCAAAAGGCGCSGASPAAEMGEIAISSVEIATSC